jgi:ABC-type transport system involved in multi-copper enzyme maturation permease subunit
MKVVSIAFNTFRENLRDKLLYNLLIFALLMIGSSVLLMRLTLGEYNRLILDIGLGSITFFGVLIAIFVGIGLVSKEIEKKTIYTIISKPVARYQFLLGKYAGLCLTLLVNTTVMAVGLLVVLYGMAALYSQDAPLHYILLKALSMIYLEFMVVTAVALLFSTFTSATLSAIFTLAVYVIGHLTADLKTFSQKMDPLGRGVLEGMYYFLPNLERFNLKGHVTHQIDVPASDLFLIAVYGMAYTTLLLMLASLIFQRRDFR